MIKIKDNDILYNLHNIAIKEKIICEIDKLLDAKYYDGFRLSRRVLKLLRYIKIHRKKFLLSKHNEQLELIQYFKKHYPELTQYYKPKSSRPRIYKVIRYLFEIRLYNEFSSGFKYDNKTKEYNAYKFVELLNLKTCPYCNRNYISIVEKNDINDKQTRPELDHFHPKSIYPFLAINYYNLIPSCSTCNKLKSDDDSLALLHPYDDKINNINITYWLNDMKFYNVRSIKDITFESEKSLEIEIENMPDNNKKTFQLERLYQEHTDIVIELILKHLHYPQSYIEELSSFGYNKEEIYRFIFSNYLNEENLSKRPLSKLTKDIAEELNLLSYQIDNKP